MGEQKDHDGKANEDDYDTSEARTSENDDLDSDGIADEHVDDNIEERCSSDK